MSNAAFSKAKEVRDFSKIVYMSWIYGFQQCGILTSEDSDEPVQPPFKLRNSI